MDIDSIRQDLRTRLDIPIVSSNLDEEMYSRLVANEDITCDSSFFYISSHNIRMILRNYRANNDQFKEYTSGELLRVITIFSLYNIGRDYPTYYNITFFFHLLVRILIDFEEYVTKKISDIEIIYTHNEEYKLRKLYYLKRKLSKINSKLNKSDCNYFFNKVLKNIVIIAKGDAWLLDYGHTGFYNLFDDDDEDEYTPRQREQIINYVNKMIENSDTYIQEIMGTSVYGRNLFDTILENYVN